MKLFRTYIVLSLAMLIAFSASGINVSLHRCCGLIKDFSLFGEAKDCGMTNKSSSMACTEKPTSIEKEFCCNDQQISLCQLAENQVLISKSQIKETKPSFDVLFFYTLFQNWFNPSESEKEEEKPSPGLFIVEAILLLLQQFRI